MSIYAGQHRYQRSKYGPVMAPNAVLIEIPSVYQTRTKPAPPSSQANAYTVAAMPDRKSTRLNSSHLKLSRMPSSA